MKRWGSHVRHSFAAAGLGLVACGEPTPPPPPPPAIRLEVVGGDNQSGVEGLALPAPFQVRATRGGAPLNGSVVEWTVATGAGTLLAGTLTDAQGLSSNAYQLGGAGPQTVKAALVGSSASGSFRATATANRAPQLVAEVPVPANYGLHDTFVRDGIAFLCAWNSGVLIYDVGNGIKGGSPQAPQLVGSLVTSANGVAGGPAVHNAWWFHNPVRNEKRYLFIGQEGPASLFNSASGDIHVVDVANLEQPQEVAFFHLADAGTHNFWMDEPGQVLYAAYYNGGVVALDVSGTLQGDLSARLKASVKPGGPTNTFVWGVQLANGALWALDILSGFWKLDATTLQVLGGGNNVPERYGSDLWVLSQYAYSGTWGGSPRNGARGDVIKVWRVGGAGPVLVDSLKFANIFTVSDLQASNDGRFLVATAERQSGAGLYLLSLSDPAKPAIVGYALMANGFHTGTLEKIGARFYVFTAKNPPNPALQIYDVTGLVP